MNFIQEALEKTTDTKALEIGKDALLKSPQMFRTLFGDSRAVVIYDKRIDGEVGELVEKILLNAKIDVCPSLIFDEPCFFAEWGFVEKIEAYLKKYNAIGVAVGGGTINDLTKLASFHINQQYMIVATAPSMDGYAAYGASISYKGNKQSFSCPAPLGLILDSEIAAKSKDSQIASGYSDLQAKITAGADWLIADFLGEDKLNEEAFNLVQKRLKYIISKPQLFPIKDEQALTDLSEGLILSGIAMQLCKSSRPASGLEHLFSHYWDMLNLQCDGRFISHGFKVAIGTLVSTACLEFLLKINLKDFDINDRISQWRCWEKEELYIKELLKDLPIHCERAVKEAKEKYIDKQQLQKELYKLKTGFVDFQSIISKQYLSYKEIENNLRIVGAPFKPSMIGLTNLDVKNALFAMPYMRERFTSIDVIYRLGMMNQLSDYLFGKGGYFEI